MSYGPKILYEWQFVGYSCRVVETEPGIVHFEQAQGSPATIGALRRLAFNHTEKPLGAANELVQLSMALAEKEEINRTLSATVTRWKSKIDRYDRAVALLRHVAPQLETITGNALDMVQDFLGEE